MFVISLLLVVVVRPLGASAAAQSKWWRVKNVKLWNYIIMFIDHVSMGVDQLKDILRIEDHIWNINAIIKMFFDSMDIYCTIWSHSLPEMFFFALFCSCDIQTSLTMIWSNNLVLLPLSVFQTMLSLLLLLGSQEADSSNVPVTCAALINTRFTWFI